MVSDAEVLALMPWWRWIDAPGKVECSGGGLIDRRLLIDRRMVSSIKYQQGAEARFNDRRMVEAKLIR